MATVTVLKDIVKSSGTHTVKSGIHTVVSVASLPIAMAANAYKKVESGVPKQTGLINALSIQIPTISNIPSFLKIIFLVVFFLFFYKILYDIGIFFGANSMELALYMAWFGVLLLFASFLTFKRSVLY